MPVDVNADAPECSLVINVGDMMPYIIVHRSGGGESVDVETVARGLDEYGAVINQRDDITVRTAPVKQNRGVIAVADHHVGAGLHPKGNCAFRGIKIRVRRDNDLGAWSRRGKLHDAAAS